MPFTESDEFNECNGTFIDTPRKLMVNYSQNPKSQKPHVKVLFNFSHAFVPDDLQQLSQPYNYPNGTTTNQRFTQPLRVFDSDEHARRAFEAMLTRLQSPYEFRPKLCELRWRVSGDLIHGFDELVDRVSEAAASVVREAAAGESHGTVKSIEIEVDLMKWTPVDAATYSIMMEDHLYDDDDDDDDDDEEEEEDDDDGIYSVTLEELRRLDLSCVHLSIEY